MNRATEPVGLSRAAHLDAVLRCWAREHGIPVGSEGLTASLPDGRVVSAKCTHVSLTGHHSFEAVQVTEPDGTTWQPTPAQLVDALTAGSSDDGSTADGSTADGERQELLDRVEDSVRNLACFAGSVRHAEPDEPLFLTGERSLLLGHLLHPAPKSRDRLSPQELHAYSPELGGRFRMHWFEAHRSVVAHDHVAGSAAMGGRDTVALLQDIAGVAPDGDHVLVPAHPWQARAVLDRPAVADLVEQGRLRALGPLGDEWFATSSLRTLFHPAHPVMLKLSLGLRITNSVRESTATELRRGLEVHELIDAGYLADPDHAFTIVRDPAWLAVPDPADPSSGTLTGLDVAVREVPEDVNRMVCLAGLVAPLAPDDGRGWGPSHLARWVEDPERWLAEYVDRVLLPMVRIYGATGVGLEGHQQNTLVRLDESGAVTGGGYRDNQGYYLATSRCSDVLAVTGRDHSTLAVVDDDIVEDRLTYYLLHNQALSLVGSMAAQGMASEQRLLDVLRHRLEEALPALDRAGPAAARLARRWLHADFLPCKANLATRLRGIDEVVAPLDAQSVYLDVPNPLAVNR